MFALAALLILYSHHKGQLDENHNGIPDFLERSAPKFGTAISDTLLERSSE